MFLILLPAVYLLAALVWFGLLLAQRPLSGLVLPLPLAATVLGALLSAYLLVSRGPVDVPLLRWTPADVFGGDLRLYADSLSSLFVALLTLLALAASVAERPTLATDDPFTVVAALLLTSAATLFVLAGNLLTLAGAWLFMDLATLAAPRWLQTSRTAPRVQALALNYLGGVLVFLAGITSLSQNPALAGQVWTPGALAPLAPRFFEAGWTVNPAVLLALAAYVRLGAYPFHRNVPDAGSTPLAAWLRLTPLVVGAYLLARAASLAAAAPLSGSSWTLVTGLATLIAAVLAWLAAAHDDTVRWLAVYAASGILLVLASAPSEAGLLIILGGVALVLAVGTLALAEPLSYRGSGWTRRWVEMMRSAAIWALWGGPLTLGFIYRWGGYRAALDAGDLPALVWSALAAAFAAAALWTLAFDTWQTRRLEGRLPAPVRWPDLVGLTLLGLPLVVLGLQPLLITPALDLVTAPGASSRLADLVRGTSSGQGVQIGLLLVIPWLIGLALSLLRRRVPAEARLGQSVQAWLRLDWLNTRRWRPVAFGTRLLRLVTGLGEGERYVGLLAVFALIVALALLTQQ